MADSKLTGLTEVSVPALDDVLYEVDVSDTTDDAAGSSRKVTIARVLGVNPAVCTGRLTLSSGAPIPTTDLTGVSTLYFTPFRGKNIALYDGTRWELHAFTERSLALSGLTTDSNYDVFLYDNSGTLTLELSAVWTNDTTRADAISLTDGIYLKSSATTRRYLGTIRTTGTTTTEDSKAKRFVWNASNRVQYCDFRAEGTNSWTNSGNGTWSAMNSGSSVWKFEFVRGLNEDNVCASVEIAARNDSGSVPSTAIAFDSTSSVDITKTTFSVNQEANVVTGAAQFTDMSSLGYHYLQGVQTTSDTNTATWFGDNGGSVGSGNVAINSGFRTWGWR